MRKLLAAVGLIVLSSVSTQAEARVEPSQCVEQVTARAQDHMVPAWRIFIVGAGWSDKVNSCVGIVVTETSLRGNPSWVNTEYAMWNLADDDSVLTAFFASVNNRTEVMASSCFYGSNEAPAGACSQKNVQAVMIGYFSDFKRDFVDLTKNMITIRDRDPRSLYNEGANGDFFDIRKENESHENSYDLKRCQEKASDLSDSNLSKKCWAKDEQNGLLTDLRYANGGRTVCLAARSPEKCDAEYASTMVEICKGKSKEDVVDGATCGDWAKRKWAGK